MSELHEANWKAALALQKSTVHNAEVAMKAAVDAVNKVLARGTHKSRAEQRVLDDLKTAIETLMQRRNDERLASSHLLALRMLIEESTVRPLDEKTGYIRGVHFSLDVVSTHFHEISELSHETHNELSSVMEANIRRLRTNEQTSQLETEFNRKRNELESDLNQKKVLLAILGSVAKLISDEAKHAVNELRIETAKERDHA